MNQVTSASLRYPLSVFNKNSTLKAPTGEGWWTRFDTVMRPTRPCTARCKFRRFALCVSWPGLTQTSRCLYIVLAHYPPWWRFCKKKSAHTRFFAASASFYARLSHSLPTHHCSNGMALSVLQGPSPSPGKKRPHVFNSWP